MKVYISVDMEGICGIVLREQVFKGSREYEEARYLLVHEVNAAVEGALKGGADEVVVMDAHATGYNFIPEELHTKAMYVLGRPSKNERFPFMDSSFDMMFLLGYHSMVGTERAVRDHSFNSLQVERIKVNGIEMGEIGMDALVCGSYNVPVSLVTGDEKACKEAQVILGNIDIAVVKYGLGRHCALNYSPKKAREIVMEAACGAVKKAGRFKPYKLIPPFTIEIDYLSTDIVDGIYANGNDIIRTGPRSMIYKTDNILEVFSKPIF